jgi:hypothetical protein
MTTAQVLFAGLAGMENAQIIAGNGLVKRGEEGEAGSTSTAEYFAAKRALTPGTPEYDALRKIAQKQKPLRRILENKIQKLALEDQRYR